MARCSEQVHGQHLEKSLGGTVCEARLRGSSVASSVASEQRSRSSSLNSTDSGSGLLPPGSQTAPELGHSGQPSSQRFSVISSEDFDQELIVKPIKVKKRRRKRKPGTVCGQAHLLLWHVQYPGQSLWGCAHQLGRGDASHPRGACRSWQTGVHTLNALLPAQ